jgi:hypothetical protein
MTTVCLLRARSQQMQQRPMNCLLAKWVPAAIILSMFSTATAFTLMTTSPSPATGSGKSAYLGGPARRAGTRSGAR